MTLTAVLVGELSLSDHSLIVADMALHVDRDQPVVSVVEHRSWHNFDIYSCSVYLAALKLVTYSPSDVTKFFACYDNTLRSLTDIHAPLIKVTRRQPTAPWYNAGCRAVKTKSRRLERVHRWFRFSHSLKAWK